MGEARVESGLIGKLARTRSDRAAYPGSSIRGESGDWEAVLPSPNRDASSCNLRSRIRGARLNPSTDLALQECAVVSLCKPPSGEQDSIRRVRFGPETKPTSVLRRNRWLKPQTTVIRHGLPSRHHVLGVRFAECVCSPKHRTLSRGARPAHANDCGTAEARGEVGGRLAASRCEPRGSTKPSSGQASCCSTSCRGLDAPIHPPAA